jgi:Flp pilus assembly protein TadG
LKMLKDKSGQAIVEFALVIGIYIMFIIGLINIIWGITSAFFAQQMAHETARKYAVTQNKPDAEEQGRTYLYNYASIFIDPTKTKVTVEKKDNKTSQSTVVVTPRLTSGIVFNKKTITRTAQSPFTDFIRHPDKYH